MEPTLEEENHRLREELRIFKQDVSSALQRIDGSLRQSAPSTPKERAEWFEFCLKEARRNVRIALDNHAIVFEGWTPSPAYLAARDAAV